MSFFFFGRPQGPQRRSSRSPLGLDCFSADIIRALREFRVFRFRAIRTIRARGIFLSPVIVHTGCLLGTDIKQQLISLARKRLVS